MNPFEVGRRLVELTTSDRDAVALDELYHEDVVSIETANEEDGEAQTWQGIAAVKEKHDWWNGVTTLHGMTAEGPFAGGGDSQFVVRYTMDITMEGQERTEMSEVGLFTVEGGKIVREVYLPLSA